MSGGHGRSKVRHWYVLLIIHCPSYSVAYKEEGQDPSSPRCQAAGGVQKAQPKMVAAARMDLAAAMIWLELAAATHDQIMLIGMIIKTKLKSYT